MKPPLDVEIMGRRLTVASDDADEHVRTVARYVDERMRQLAGGRPDFNTIDLALLTALNIASEYWKLETEQKELQRTISRLSDRVLARLSR